MGEWEDVGTGGSEDQKIGDREIRGLGDPGVRDQWIGGSVDRGSVIGRSGDSGIGGF